jgi:AcrR family transcriptional regulator
VAFTKAERSTATRRRLIATARALFAKRGFAAVGTEEIVKRARVTRGALYHHFRDKRDLFRAVHVEVEAEMAGFVRTQLAQTSVTQPMELFRAGARAFLDKSAEPAYGRIALIEAPTVVGWAEWRAVDERYGLGLVITGLQAAMAAGAITVQPAKPLAHLLRAAIGEAGMLIANSSDRDTVRAEVEPALLTLFDGLVAPVSS